MDRFYVYEHRRADSGAVFYVGKGSGYRLRVEQHRGAAWRAIAGAVGYSAAIVVRGLDEELAQLAERELIAKHRALGVDLVNITAGGGGMTGYRWDPAALERRAAKQKGQSRPTVSAKLRGIPKTEAHRRKLAVARTGMKHSAATRAEMSATRRLRPVPRRTCERCGVTMTVLNFGRWHTPCAKEG